MCIGNSALLSLRAPTPCFLSVRERSTNGKRSEPPLNSFMAGDLNKGAVEKPSLEERRARRRSEEHTSELQSPCNLVCRLLLEKKNTNQKTKDHNALSSHY